MCVCVCLCMYVCYWFWFMLTLLTRVFEVENTQVWFTIPIFWGRSGTVKLAQFHRLACFLESTVENQTSNLWIHSHFSSSEIQEAYIFSSLCPHKEPCEVGRLRENHWFKVLWWVLCFFRNLKMTPQLYSVILNIAIHGLCLVNRVVLYLKRKDLFHNSLAGKGKT